jgi:hypothetical protein
MSLLPGEPIRQGADRLAGGDVNFDRNRQPLAKFIQDCKKCQGTTLVVPEEQQNHVGLQPLRFLSSAFCNSAAARAKPE